MIKWKKIVAIAIAAVMTLSLTACGSNTSSSDNTADNTASGTEVSDSSAESTAAESSTESGGGEIRLVNGKIEIDEQLKTYAEKYEEKTGVKVNIESLGGGVDISGTLKGYLAAGNMPDMYVFGGEGDYNTWKDYMADLSDQPWVSDTDVAYKTSDGKVVGFPYAVEGYGITYNADILEKAGVDPASLTNINAYKEAFEKIDSMKSVLGITAVCSVAAESGQMYWSTGNHIFGSYLAQGLDRSDTTYIDMLKKGETDTDRMTQFADFLELLFQYADKNTLISGTYDDQLALWAQGKTAFITQGNWIDPSLPDYNVSFDSGIAPLAIMEEDTDGILADAPSWWAVYNEGGNKQLCYDFMNSLASTEEGAECLVTDCGMISPFASTMVEPTTPLAVSLMGWVKAGKTYSWQWSKMPEGIALNATGVIFESFAKGDIDKEQFVTMMGTAVSDYAK